MKTRKNQGITLIALVITIIVLLILAGITIAMLTGENGIITKTEQAKIKTIHSRVYEELNIKTQAYLIEKINNKQIDNTLINDLKVQGIIDNDCVIDTKILLGEKQELGNGTITSGDVYVIELNGNKNEGKYKVVYYNKGEKEELGFLEDIKEKGVIAEPMEPTAVYAKAYQDGTLILSSKEYTDESKVIYADYGDVSKKEYDYDETKGELIGNIPGWMDVTGFQRVIIYDKIAPTNMCYWFDGMSDVTEMDLININTSNVKNMKYLFSGCTSLKSVNISNWDTSKVENMLGMFSRCHQLENLDVTCFNTKNVKNMSSMFDSCYALKELNVSNFDTSSVTNMKSMFGSIDVVNLDVSNFKTDNVVNMAYMFDNSSDIKKLDLSNFNTRKVEYMNGMFNQCRALESLTFGLDFDTSKVQGMSAMFSGCENLKELDVSGFDTNNVTNMRAMFSGCGNLKELDVSGFRTDKVTDMNSMFEDCTNLSKLNVSNFDTGSVTDMFCMFAYCKSLESLDISNFNFEKIKGNGMNRMLYDVSCTVYVKNQEMIDLLNSKIATSDTKIYQIKE